MKNTDKWITDDDGNIKKEEDLKRYNEFLTELSSSEILYNASSPEIRSYFNKLVEKIQTGNNRRLIYEYSNGRTLEALLKYHANIAREVS